MIKGYAMLDKYKNEFNDYVRKLQDLITEQLLLLDPKINITEDNWQRTDFAGNAGGGGRTRAFSGSVIENAGVNTSLIFGKVDPTFAKNIGGTNDEIWAAGISLIIHPRNPKVPTVHANFRMINAGEKFWFGGGADLTPFYPAEEDFTAFHQVWKDALEPYGHYQEMKGNILSANT